MVVLTRSDSKQGTVPCGIVRALNALTGGGGLHWVGKMEVWIGLNALTADKGDSDLFGRDERSPRGIIRAIACPFYWASRRPACCCASRTAPSVGTTEAQQVPATGGQGFGPRLLSFSQDPLSPFFLPQLCPRRPTCAPVFASIGLVFSHLLRFTAILRTPLPFQPIFARFSRGGAQKRFSRAHYTRFSRFDKGFCG